MKNTIEKIVFEVEKFNNSIIEALDSKNITNTGEAARSLRIEFGDDFVRSIGIFYLEFLDTGRYSGSYAPFSAISKWVATKLGITDEKENKKVTWAVIKKIQLVGTEIARNNKNGIELTKKIAELRKNIVENVGTSVQTDVIQLLNEYKKKWKLKNQI